jgi:hypothetical protein
MMALCFGVLGHELFDHRECLTVHFVIRMVSIRPVM